MTTYCTNMVPSAESIKRQIRQSNRRLPLYILAAAAGAVTMYAAITEMNSHQKPVGLRLQEQTIMDARLALERVNSAGEQFPYFAVNPDLRKTAQTTFQNAQTELKQKVHEQQLAHNEYINTNALAKQYYASGSKQRYNAYMLYLGFTFLATGLFFTHETVTTNSRRRRTLNELMS